MLKEWPGTDDSDYYQWNKNNEVFYGIVDSPYTSGVYVSKDRQLAKAARYAWVSRFTKLSELALYKFSCVVNISRFTIYLNGHIAT